MQQELIWELMKQAGELAYEEHKAKCLEEGLDPERTVWSVTGATYEKFAELIVAECMACSTWVGKMNTNSGEPIHTAHAINQRIKQQFGVEE